jgi:hypothetical protein
MHRNVGIVPKEITFGELIALGGSVPHPKNRVRNDCLWGIVRGEEVLAAAPPLPPPFSLFTDMPVIPNRTEWREESAG